MVAAATSAAVTDGADITDAVFRASPAYYLTPYERLSAAERHSVSQLSADPTFYGLFLPRRGRDDASATIKTADTDTALLAYTLQQPGSLPSYVRLQLGPRLNATVLRLVLDGVLEMKWGEAFVSGPQAHRMLFPEVLPYRGQGRLGALSFAALRYAELLHDVPANQISDRLYFYNRWPISAEWKARLANDAARRSYIGIDRAPTTRSLDRHWRARTDSDREAAWFYWSSRAATDAPNSETAAGMWKAYVSPAPNAIADIFAALVETLGNNSAAFGLHRAP